MWQPTHVKVTVKQAKNLIPKGKNGTNDAFVVIGIGKEKYQTSVKEKASSPVEWREECELAIPSQGNQATVQLTVYHSKGLGMDDFLGQIALPLSDFDVYEKPKYRSYRLKGKPEKDKKKGEKERGELDVMVNFTVKSESFLDANKKEKDVHKSSLTSIKKLGGSLMSLGSRGGDKQGIKNFAKSISSKMDKIAKPKKKKKVPKESDSTFHNDLMASQQYHGYADPGVISDDDDDNDDFRFDDDIKVNTRTSSPMSTMSRGSSLAHEQVLDTDYEVGSYEDHEQDFSCSLGKTPPKPPRILDLRKEPLSKSEVRGSPMNSERVTSFFDAKPSSRGEIFSEVSRTIVEEDLSPVEDKREKEMDSFSLRTAKSKMDELDESAEPAVDMTFSIIDQVPPRRQSPVPEDSFNPFTKSVEEPDFDSSAIKSVPTKRQSSPPEDSYNPFTENIVESQPEVKPRKKFFIEPKVEVKKQKLDDEPLISDSKKVSGGLDDPKIEEKMRLTQKYTSQTKILSKTSEAESVKGIENKGVIKDESFDSFKISRKLESKPRVEVDELKTRVIPDESHNLKSLPKVKAEPEILEIQSVSGAVHTSDVDESSIFTLETHSSPVEEVVFNSALRDKEADVSPNEIKLNTKDLFTENLKTEDIIPEQNSQKVVWLESFSGDISKDDNMSGLHGDTFGFQKDNDGLQSSPRDREESNGGPDSAISLDNDQESISSQPHSISNASSVFSSSSVTGDPVETRVLPETVAKDRNRSPFKPLLKSSSNVEVLMRHGSAGRRLDRTRGIQSSTDALKDFQDADDGPAITRSGSLKEKRSPTVAATPVATMATVQPQPTLVDEWERKLYGRSGFTGSTENMSISGSRSSLNTSRESSVHDVRKEDSFTRLPEVKALTLERSPLENNEDNKKQKKPKSKMNIKNRLFNIGGSRDRLNEEGRFVEGGNDRLPSIPTKPSKLPREIYDKFAGKSKEDLMEMILELQSNLDKQVKHSSDLENYIDNLLLRVMEATPHILQAPIETGKGFKGY